MILKYVETKKEKPPILKRVRVRPWKEHIWLDKHNYIRFIPGKEYYGVMISVAKWEGGYEFVWDIEEFEKYHFPIETFTYWVKELPEPIWDRFEILDL
jgi:hypothetical protein